MKKITIALLLAFVLTAIAPQGVKANELQNTNEQQEYIVRLKDMPSDAVRLMSLGGLSEINSERGIYLVSGEDELRALGGLVEYAEPNAKAYLYDVGDYNFNDTYVDEQWHFASTGYDSEFAEKYDGEGVKVGIVDSGIVRNHEDFEDTNIEIGKSMFDGSNDTSDQLGHGTFIASTLASTTNNGKGVAGLCSNVTIIPIKCFGDNKDTDLSYIINGIYAAVDKYHCDVINLSLGTEADSVFLKDAVNHAVNSGAIIVAAVGNDGTTSLQYPAAYGNVVGVGSYNREGKSAWFSQFNESVYVIAPGVNLVAAGKNADGIINNTSYDMNGAGTSYSTPMVSAAAVMLKQFNKNATAEDFMALLKNSSIDAGLTGYDVEFGWGKLNYSNFINLMEQAMPTPTPTPTPQQHTFNDMKGHWAEQYADFCYERGLFKGDENNNFLPDTYMNRAMFITVLSRVDGDDISGYENVFSDVADNAWYAQACAWGKSKGYINGTGGNKFSPLKPVTREQLVAMLYRYSQTNNLLADTFPPQVLAGFEDNGEVSDYAFDAMIWAVGNGIITGREGKLCPKFEAPRSEVAVICNRYCNAIDAEKK